MVYKSSAGFSTPRRRVSWDQLTQLTDIKTVVYIYRPNFCRPRALKEKSKDFVQLCISRRLDIIDEPSSGDSFLDDVGYSLFKQCFIEENIIKRSSESEESYTAA
jgi:hypothetical protein